MESNYIVKFHSSATESSAKVLNTKIVNLFDDPGCRSIELQDKDTKLAPKNVRVKRVGNDLQVRIDDAAEGPVDLVIKDYYPEGGELVGLNAEGQYVEYVPVDGQTGYASLGDGLSSIQQLSADAAEMGICVAAVGGGSPWLVWGAAGLGAVALAAASGGSGTGTAPDTTAPAAPTGAISADGTTLSGTAEAGATVGVDTNGDGTPDVTAVADASGNYSVTLNPPVYSGASVGVRATDAAGNTSPVTSVAGTGTAPDTMPPAAPTVSVPEAAGGINATEAADGVPVLVTLPAGAVAGDVITVSIDGSTPITHTVTAAEAAAPATPISVLLPATNITAAGQGPATITTTYADAAGNAAAPVTTAVNIDTMPPAAPTVSVPEAAGGINATEAADGVPVLVTLPAGAVAGDVITVSIDGSTPITHTVTAAEAAAPATPISVLLPATNITAAGQGPATITTTYADAAGNAAAPVTTAVNIDTMPPAAPTVSVPEAAGGINATEAADGVPVLVTLPAGAVAGDVITVSIDGSTPITHTVTAAEAAAPATPISVLLPATNITAAGQGPATITTTYADAAGNAAAPVTTAVNIDTMPPAAPTVSVPEAAGGINATEAADGVPVLVTLPAGAVAGDVITVSIDGSTPITHTVTAAEAAAPATPISVLLPATNITAAGQGPATITTTYADAAGNAAAPVTTAVDIGTMPPAAPTVSVPEAAGGINATEAADGVPVLVTLPAGAVAGDVITVSIDGSTPITHTVTAAEAAAPATPISVLLPATNITAAGQGPATITTTYADAAGNAAAPVTTAVDIGTMPPAAPTVSVPEAAGGINATEAADGVPVLVTLPAGAVAGDVITVSIDGSTPITHTVTAAEAAAPATPISVLLPAADITAAGQGPATITTTYADAAGNAAAPVTTAVNIDTVAPPAAPTVSVPEAAGGINATEAADGVPVLVTLPAGAVAGDVITVSIDGSTPITHTVTAAEAAAPATPISVLLPAADITAAGQGPATITTTYADAAGNAAAPVTTAVDIDTVAPPAAPTVSVPEAAGGINATEAADGVPVLVTLPAGAVAGDVITVSIDGSTPITHTVTAAEAAAPATPISVLLPAADITAAGQGPATITTTYADAAGNAAAPVTTAVDIGTMPPAAPTVSVPEAAGGINATEAADGVPVLVTLPAGAVAGDVITVSIDGSTPITHTVTAAEAAAPATPISVLLPAADITAAGQGAATITTTYADAAGNAAAPVTTAVNIDTVAPTAPTVSVPEAAGGINATEAANGVPVLVTLPAGAVAGDVITVSIDGSTPITHTVTAAEAAAPATPISVLLPAADITAAGQGAATITTTYADAAGIAAAPVTTAVNIDTVAPTAPTVSVPEAAGGINATEAANGVPVLVTLPAGAVAGDVITVSIDGSTPITHTVTAAEAAAPATPISVLLPAADITAAGQGAATITTTYADAAGNAAAPVTTAVNIDTVAPTAPTVSVPEAAGGINATEAADGVPVLVTLPAGAVAGDVITVSIDGSTPVSYTVTAADVAAPATPISVLLPAADITAAGQGAATITTTYADAAGIAAAPVTTAVNIDTVAPTAPTVSVPEAAGGINATEAANGVPVLVTLPAGAVAGDVITVSIDGSTPITHTVTAAEAAAPATPISVLLPAADITAAGQGAATITTTYADAAGNAAAPVTTAVNIDTVAPTAPTVSVPEAAGGINATEAADGVPVLVTLPAGAVAGDVITVSIDGSTPITHTVTAAEAAAPATPISVLLPAADITAAGQGAATITTTYADAAGIAAAPVTTAVNIDTVAPTAPTVSVPEAAGGINATEAANGVPVLVTLPAGAVAGDVITVSIDGSTPITHTVTAAEAAAPATPISVLLPAADITAAGQGAATITTTYADAAGNAAAPVTTAVNIDTVAPTAPTVSVPEAAGGINATEAANGVPVLVTLPAGAVAGDVITVSIDGSTPITHTVTAAEAAAPATPISVLLPATDITAAGQGPATITTTYADAAGNAAAPVTTAVNIDTVAPTAPTVSVPEAAGGINATEAANGVPVLVTLPAGAVAGDVITVSIDGSTPITHTVTAAEAAAPATPISVLLPAADITAAGQGAATITTTYADAAGIAAAPVTTAVNIDTVAPTAPTVSVPEAAGGINATEAADGVPVLVTLPAGAVAGDVITVSIDGSTPITHTVTAAEAAAPATPISVLLPAADITAAGQGAATITTTYADAAGNAAAPVTTAVNIDTVAPTAPTVSVPEAAGGINATEAANGVPVLVTLPAGAVAGDVITVSIDGSTPITHTVTAAEAAAPATPISVLLPAADITAAGQGAATITTTYADAAGIAAAPVTTAVNIDTVAPTAPTVSVPEAAGGINATEAANGVPVLVTLPAGAVAGDVITVSIDGSTPITHTVTAAEAAAPATPISVLLPAADITAAGQGAATITTTYADAAGNAAAPVTTAVNIDTVAPTAPTVSVPEAAGGINATEAANGVPVLVTLPAGAVAGDVITVSIDGSTPITHTVTAAEAAAPATPISVLLPAADITAAGQGAATITTTYADAAGIAAAPVTTAVNIDTVAPTAPTVSVPEAAGGINATEAANGVPVLVTLPAGAVAGDVITVSIDGSTPITHTVTAAEAAAPATPISVLLPAADITAAGQGAATITTTYADAAGNAAAPVTTAVNIDTVAPTAPTVSVPEAAGGINATEAANGVPVLVTLPAGAVAGDVITVSIDGSTPITHTVTAAEAAAPATPISVLLPAADITAAGQGAATITTTYADAAGIAAAPVTTAVNIDTVAPTAPTVSVPEAAGGINATEAANGVPVLVTLPAGAVAGDVITVSIDGSTPITHTVTAAEAAAPATPISVLLPAADITAAGQGAATITTTYADAAGNAAAPVTTAVNIDTVAPTAPTVSVPEAAGGINATEAANGVPVLVTLPAGAVAGDVITVSIDGSTPITHTVTAAEAAAPATPISVLLPAADITAAGQGAATITTTYADAAGNAAAPVTTAVNIDTVAPTAPTVSVPEAAGGINATEAANGVPVLVTLPAGAVAGDVITVSIDGSTPITHTVTAAEAAAPATPISVLLPAADITAAGQGAATITTTYADAAGIAAAPVTTAVNIDTVAPTAPTVSVPEAAGGINATEAANGVPVLVTLPAGAVAGDVITVSIDGSTPITHTVTAAEAAAPATPISVLLPAADITAAGQGAATITTTYADAAGNAAAPVTTAVNIDTVAPTAPTVSVPEAAGGINATEAANGVPVLVTLPAGAVAGDVITVSIDGSTPITHTVTAAEAAAPATPISVLLPATDITAAGQGPATITTTYADAAGNAAAPVTTAVNIDTVAPTAPTVSVPEAAGGINATEAADGVPVLVTLPAGAVAGDVITVSIDGSTPITHTVTAAEAAAPATPISVLLPAADITAAGQGAATITTTYADAAGNAAAPVTTAVNIDTVAPTAPTVSVPEAAGGINATEAANGVPVLVTLPAGAVAGDVITVSIDGSTPITHTVTAAEAAAPATPISVLLPAADITAAGQGAATITTTYADAAGNAAAPVTTAVNIDTVAPTAPTVSVPEAAGGINATEAANGVPVLVTLPAGAVAGDVITVSIDGSTPITHTVTAAEAAAPATPISVLLPAADITAAGQGAATITTTYADAAGNAAAPVTTAVNIDTVAPTAPTVSVPEAAGGINATEAANGVPVLVTLPAGAVAGDVITVSIDGSTPITHTVTAAEAAAPATPISVLLPAADITAAGQGPATITTTYADAAGNAAAPVTTAVNIDTVAPTAPTVSVPEAAGGINATEAANGVPVLVTLPAGAVAGDVITVSIDGSTPITHTVTAAEAAAPATPISVLLPAADITAAGQGAATITTTYADAAGNAAAPVTTAVNIDTVAPTAPTVSVPEAAGGINATEAANGVPVLVTLPAGAVAGDVITVSIDGSTPITHTVTAAEAAAPATPISVLLPAADITAAGQGAATITTTYADAAGIAAAPVTTAVNIDTVAPTAPTVSVPEAAGGINATEAANGVPVLVTLPAGAVAGDVITVSIDGSTPITHTVTAAEAAAPATPISVLLPAADITAAGQGAATITTTYADAAGNAAAPVTTAVNIDTVAPTAPTVSVPEAAGGINATEAANGVPVLVTLPAGAVAGDVITVSIDGSTPITHTVTAAEAAAPATPISVLLPATDITAAGQGPATITTTYADAAGNAAAPVTTAVNIDTVAPTAPTVSVPEAAGGINATEAANGVPVLVTLPAGAVAGDVITVSIDGSTPITHTVTAAEAAAPATPISVLLPAADITAAGQGAATITTTYADAAGNAAAPVTTAVNIDTVAPTAPTVSVPEAAGGINATEAANGVPVLVTLPAGAVAGDVITVSIDGSTPITHTVTAAEAAAPATPISVLLPAADITAAGQGAATITTTYADAAGNAAAPVTTAVNIDTVAPTAPTVSVPEAAGGINATEAANGVPVLVTLPAGAVAGDVITVSIDGSTPITHTVTAAEAAAPATPISVLLPAADITAAGQGAATITTTYADAAGNAAAPVTTAVNIDTVAPTAPTVSVPEAAGGINATEAANGVPVLVTLPAGAVAGDVITVSIDGSTPITHTVTAAEAAAPATPISVLLPAADITAAGQGPATITTTYADAAGNAAAPVTTAVNIDTVAPTAPTVSVPEAAGGINATEAANGVPVLVTLPAGAVAGDVITVSIDGSTPITHTVTAAEAAAPATPISVLLPAADITAAGQGAATITTTYADAAGNAAAPVTTAVNIDTTPPATVSSVTPSPTTVNEGSNEVLSVNLSSTAGNASLSYAITGTGITTGDFGTAVFNNGVTLNGDGTLNVPTGVSSFTITLPVSSDSTTEGSETANFNVGGQSASVGINDTSTSSPAGQPTISLGTLGQLIKPVQVEGHWYYVWDRNSDGMHGGGDSITMDALETLAGIGNIDETNRTFTLNGVQLRLPTDGLAGSTLGSAGWKPGTSWSNATPGWNTDPSSNATYDDLMAIWDAFNGTGSGTNMTGVPSGWGVTDYLYWSATPSASGHAYVYLSNGGVGDNYDHFNYYVAFEVL